MDCIATAEQVFTQQQQQRIRHQSSSNNVNNMASISEWNEFIRELKRRETGEKARMEARDRARSQANEE